MCFSGESNRWLRALSIRFLAAASNTLEQVGPFSFPIVPFEERVEIVGRLEAELGIMSGERDLRAAADFVAGEEGS